MSQAEVIEDSEASADSGSIFISLEEGIVDGFLNNCSHTNHEDGKKSLDIKRKPAKTDRNWDYPGWGTRRTIEDIESEQLPPTPKQHKLGLFRATAIAGNDLIGSVLYTIGICSATAGVFAPVCLILVCIALWPFRKIYSEVGTALPLNGGTYNCLLNATTKHTATIAACLSFLSYAATAVVSASSASEYAYGELGSFNKFWVTIAILAFFALLLFFGIRESSIVALSIFAFHALTLLILIVLGIIELVKDKGSILSHNFHASMSNPANDIFFGFCVGLLGITGFETSANYIQEQKPGVFPKNMNAMWCLVTFFNPLIAFLAVAVVPVAELRAHSGNALSVVAGATGGNWFRIWFAIDAVVVLCGGVLTAFVGVTGLIERLAADRCLPGFFLSRNRFTKTHHFIILAFFIITSTLYAALDGNLTSLGGVFAVSFLSVMCMFAIGNMFLKYKRPKLKRAVTASWFAVALGLSAMLTGLIGNLVNNPAILKYFVLYFVVPMAFVTITLNQIRIAKILLYFIERTPFRNKLVPLLRDRILKMKQLTVVFFTKTDEIHVLNKAVHYTHSNEHCDRIMLVHLYETDANIPHHLEENHYILDHVYPKIQIDLLLVKGKFCPETVEKLSKRLGVPLSFMFVRCFNPDSDHHIGDFGGVRTIML